MWLILTNVLDPAGPWLAAGLSVRVFDTVVRITEVDLGHAQLWEHFVDRDHSCFRFQLADGRWIDSRKIKGVINRLNQPPFARMAADHGSKQLYAVSEITTLLMGCLARAGCLILNSLGSQGATEVHRDPKEWQALAAAAGLPMRASVFNSPHWSASAADDTSRVQNRLVVIAENVLLLGPADTVPGAIRSAAIRLAALARTPVLELHFLQDQFSHWNFQSAQACTDLMAAGDAALDAVASLILDSTNAQSQTPGASFSLSPFLPDAAICL